MAYLKWTFSAGHLIKGSILSTIKQAAFLSDVEVNIKKCGWGLVEVDYALKATGSDENILDFKERLDVLVAQSDA